MSRGERRKLNYWDSRIAKSSKLYCQTNNWQELHLFIFSGNGSLCSWTGREYLRYQRFQQISMEELMSGDCCFKTNFNDLGEWNMNFLSCWCKTVFGMSFRNYPYCLEYYSIVWTTTDLSFFFFRQPINFRQFRQELSGNYSRFSN